MKKLLSLVLVMVMVLSVASVALADNTTGYTVSFNADGGSGTMAAVTGVTGNYTLPENGFTAPEGKAFSKWQVGETVTGDSLKLPGNVIEVTEDVTIRAIWRNLETYRIGFKRNTQDSTAAGTMDEQVFTEGVPQKITANAFTVSGYKFTGWNTEQNGSGTSYADGQEITLTKEMMGTTSGFSLYAQWKMDSGTAPHTHDWKFKVHNGDAIVAYCTSDPTCTYYGTDENYNSSYINAELEAIVQNEFTGLSYNGATIKNKGSFDFEKTTGATLSFVYYKDYYPNGIETNEDNSGAVSEGAAPVYVGDYYVKLAVNGTIYDIYKAFKIKPATTPAPTPTPTPGVSPTPTPTPGGNDPGNTNPPSNPNHNHNHNNSVPEVIIVEAPKTGDVSAIGYAVMAILAAAGAMGMKRK